MSATEYTVRLKNSAQKEIKGLDKVIRRRTLEALHVLRPIRDLPAAGSS